MFFNYDLGKLIRNVKIEDSTSIYFENNTLDGVEEYHPAYLSFYMLGNSIYNQATDYI